MSFLSGVGDAERMRAFAMVSTYCVHKAVSDDELATCDALSTGRTSHLAGPAAVELWRTPAFPALPLTAQRCERGVWDHVYHKGQRIKLPGDCGECPPCLARKDWDSA
jgi:hypothetical protein